jgi:hypothetical protein
MFSRLISIQQNKKLSFSDYPYSYFVLEYVNLEEDSTYVVYYGYNKKFHKDFTAGYIRFLENIAPASLKK